MSAMHSTPKAMPTHAHRGADGSPPTMTGTVRRAFRSAQPRSYTGWVGSPIGCTPSRLLGGVTPGAILVETATGQCRTGHRHENRQQQPGAEEREYHGSILRFPGVSPATHA
jgi:hypothetical protein